MPSQQYSGEPVSYGSLKDLEKGRAKSNQPAPTYTPQPSRQGYNSNADWSSSSSSSRRMPPAVAKPEVGPPPSRYDAERPSTPSRYGDAPDTIGADPTKPAPTGWSAYTSKAAEYVPTSVGAGWSSASNKVSEGWGEIANQQRKEQVVGGVTKGVATVVGGAAKLAGRGIWEIGKFATK